MLKVTKAYYLSANLALALGEMAEKEGEGELVGKAILEFVEKNNPESKYLLGYREELARKERAFAERCRRDGMGFARKVVKNPDY